MLFYILIRIYGSFKTTYFTWLFKLIKKKCICNDSIIKPPNIFVTFTSVESKQLPLLKFLYDLNSKKLIFNIPFDTLEPKHVTDLIWCDPITCTQYYDHCMRFFCTLCMKDNSIFWNSLDFFFVTKFQSHGSQHDNGLLCTNLWFGFKQCNWKLCGQIYIMW